MGGGRIVINREAKFESLRYEILINISAEILGAVSVRVV